MALVAESRSKETRPPSKGQRPKQRGRDTVRTLGGRPSQQTVRVRTGERWERVPAFQSRKTGWNVREHSMEVSEHSRTFHGSLRTAENIPVESQNVRAHSTVQEKPRGAREYLRTLGKMRSTSEVLVRWQPFRQRGQQTLVSSDKFRSRLVPSCQSNGRAPYL